MAKRKRAAEAAGAGTRKRPVTLADIRVIHDTVKKSLEQNLSHLMDAMEKDGFDGEVVFDGGGSGLIAACRFLEWSSELVGRYQSVRLARAVQQSTGTNGTE